jgi:hypothetical protein
MDYETAQVNSSNDAIALWFKQADTSANIDKKGEYYAQCATRSLNITNLTLMILSFIGGMFGLRETFRFCLPTLWNKLVHARRSKMRSKVEKAIGEENSIKLSQI